jgi:hypothetical protein
VFRFKWLSRLISAVALKDVPQIIGDSTFKISPSEFPRQIEASVFALTGILEPIVPWPFVFH